jgi:hypothetical protein
MTTHIASSKFPIKADTTELPRRSKMSGFSYTCFANLRKSGSAGGSSNSFGPYRARRAARWELERPFFASVEKSAIVS